jgi:FkbM family methyltransferase
LELTFKQRYLQHRFGQQVYLRLNGGLRLQCIPQEFIKVRDKEGILVALSDCGAHLWCPLEECSIAPSYHPSSADERRRNMISYHNITKVIDVGANAGQYGTQLRLAGYSGPIISFEPLTLPFQYLVTLSERDDEWHAVQLALGAQDIEAVMNVSANSYSSSLLPMLKRHLENAPDSRIIGQEVIAVRRFQSIAKEYVTDQDRLYLKIDTQGYEDLVLEGVGDAIKNVVLIECELSLMALYEGQKLFADMLDLLREYGFTLVAVTEVFTDRTSGYCLQVDGTFLRTDDMQPT